MAYYLSWRPQFRPNQSRWQSLQTNRRPCVAWRNCLYWIL